MSDKRRRSVTIDDDVDREVDARSDLNFSALVNDLLGQYFATGGDEKTAELLRAERLREEAGQLRDEADVKERQAKAIEDTVRERQKERQGEVEEAVDRLQNVPAQPDNPAVEAVADDVGMDPAELAAVVESRRDTSEPVRRYNY